MTDDNIPKATPTRKIFTNFRTYMHTWFPFKEEVEETISNLTESTSNTITNYAESIDEILSKKANKTELPTALSQLENDKSFITKNDVQDNLNSTNTQLPLSAKQGKVLKAYIDDKMNNLLDKTYPIGSIYMSVNNTNPSQLFGGSWTQLQNRFLLGAGTEYSNGTSGGSKDAVVVSHTHTQNPHTHTSASHSHGTVSSEHNKFLTYNGNNIVINSTARKWPAADTDATVHYVYTQDENTNITEHVQTGSTSVTIQNGTASNQYAGEDGTGKNMPPYLVVYMWKRVA